MSGIVLAFNLLVFLLACAGMMGVFLGSHPAALLVLLLVSLPVTLLTTLFAWVGLARQTSVRKSFAAAWRRLPQWLAVAFWLGMALILCGELALLVALRLADTAPAPWQHLPVLAGSSAAAGFLFAYALRNRHPR